MRTISCAPQIRTALLTLSLLVGILGGCGGGGGTTPDGTVSAGEVVIGLTDAEGDFLRYEVDVVSIQLAKADGTEVETLPLVTRVDFADLTELTEFVTAATLPSGLYTHATMTLDYSLADVQVEVDGEPVSAEVFGSSGTPLGLVDVAVQLDGRRALPIAPGIPAHLTLDFDLEATNIVDTTSPTPRVTAEPLLVAEVNPRRPKVHRVRGPLVAVDERRERFTLAIRPFRLRHHEFGRLTVETSEGTAYEVDGRTGLGTEGFALLAAKPLGTAVVALGDLDVRAHTFTAREVRAGSSVPGGELDGVTGSVLARAGDRLTVRGAVVDRTGSVTFNTDVEVEIGPDTSVTRQGEAGARLSGADLSVGQRVTVLGAYDPRTDAMDATEGLVRLLLTHLTGVVNEVRPPALDAGGELDLALQRIDGRRVALFDFSGTGTTPGEDADPAAYTAATGPMALPSVQPGDPVRVFGFASPFGAAPPDFEARTVVDASEAGARLAVRWEEANPVAITVDTGLLTLDLGGVGPVHHVGRNGIATELLVDPAPRIVPAEDRGLYAIRRAGSTRVYGSFADFAAALEGELAEGTATFVTAAGRFDDDPQVCTARRIIAEIR